MSLTHEEVQHIAILARLELSNEELERYRQQLSAILDFATRLQELDTSGIELTSSDLPLQSSLRIDEPRPGLNLEEVLQNASRVEYRQFRVPPVFE